MSLKNASSTPLGQVASHLLATANCETIIEPQRRHILAEAGSIVSDGCIASPVQTFGLTVKPFRKAGAQVYIVQCTIIKLDETKKNKPIERHSSQSKPIGCLETHNAP